MQILAGTEVIEEYDNYEEEDDGLGYYPDGVKRTLTDEQIALFRHTEIQTIIRERLRKREANMSSESDIKRELPKSPEQSSAEARQVTGSSDRVLDGRVEKQINWTKTSARTREKNMKNRKRYRAKKREDRKKKREEDEESDEWDPWHQATGPDAQKDAPVDLDY